MAVTVSNNITACVSRVTLLFAVPVIASGVWFASAQGEECARLARWPVAILGGLLLLAALVDEYRLDGFSMWLHLRGYVSDDPGRWERIKADDPKTPPARTLPPPRRVVSFAPKLQRPYAVPVPARHGGGTAGQRAVLGLASGSPCRHGTARRVRRAGHHGPSRPAAHRARAVPARPGPTPTSTSLYHFIHHKRHPRRRPARRIRPLSARPRRTPDPDVGPSLRLALPAPPRRAPNPDVGPPIRLALPAPRKFVSLRLCSSNGAVPQRAPCAATEPRARHVPPRRRRRWGVSLHPRGASRNAAWAVHVFPHRRPLRPPPRRLRTVPLRHGHAGADRPPRPRRRPERLRIAGGGGRLWQAVWSGSGDDVLLRHVAGRYLRANGRYLQWHTGVTVDAFDNLSTMMHWVVEAIPRRQTIPSLPGPPQ